MDGQFNLVKGIHKTHNSDLNVLCLIPLIYLDNLNSQPIFLSLIH